MSTYQLRHGQLTRDKKLDRVIYFDPVSRKFPIRQLIGDKPLRSYTWALEPRLDQKAEGACVGFAWAHELAARPKLIPSIINGTARWIYKEAQTIDEWAGEAYEGTSVLAGAKTVQKAGSIGEYRWGFGIQDVLLAVGYAGPGVAGLNWYEGMYNTDSKGFIHPTGQWVGGHAIVIRGVSVKGKYVLLTNSWGSDWGVQGNCKLSFDDLDRLLKEQGEFCIPTGRSLDFGMAAG